MILSLSESTISKRHHMKKVIEPNIFLTNSESAKHDGNCNKTRPGVQA
jgi:hypothetical protein